VNPFNTTITITITIITMYNHREVVPPARQLPALDQTLPQTVTSMLRALLGTLALMEVV
jgi:hypothetical protein